MQNDPTSIALRVALIVMRDPSRGVGLNLSAAHLAIALEHSTREELDALNAQVMETCDD
jgi:hypothetical protein